MKNLCLFINLLFCISISINPIISQDFTIKNGQDFYGQITSIDIDDDGYGYAHTSCDKIMLTDDFGSTWTEKNFDNNNEQIKVIPGTNGEEVIMYNMSQFLLSLNFGDTWNRINPTGSLVEDLEIIDNNTFIFADRNGQIHKTENKGISWQAYNSQIGSPIQLEFINNLQGWCMNSKGDISYSSNGGQSWEIIHLDADDINYNLLEFTSQFIGYRFSTSTLYKTTDGGMTWTMIADGSQLSSNLVVIDENKLYSFNHIVQSLSQDGGLTWVSVPNTLDAYSKLGTSGGNGKIYRYGLNKNIYRSSDLAQTFEAVSGGSSDFISQIAFQNTLLGTAVTNNGNYYQTSDGGESWTFHTTEYINFGGVHYAPDGSLIINGFSDTGILKAANHNAPLIQIQMGSFYVSKFINTSDGHIYVYHQNGVHLSTDNGSTWEHILNSADRSNSAGDALSSDFTITGNKQGLISTSTNRGLSWDTLDVFSSQRIIDINLITKDIFFIYFRDKIRLTQDGGVSYSELSTLPFNGRRFFMTDNQKGWAFGSSSQGSNQAFIFYTEDGWNTFTQLFDGCQGLSTMTQNLETEDFWFAGNGGYIISVNNNNISSTNNFHIFDAQFYPNPSSGHIRLINPFSHKSSLRILNSLGQVILKSDLIKVDPIIDIDLAAFKKGIYYISCFDGDTTYNGKIILQ